MTRWFCWPKQLHSNIHIFQQSSFYQLAELKYCISGKYKNTFVTAWLSLILKGRNNMHNIIQDAPTIRSSSIEKMIAKTLEITGGLKNKITFEYTG